MRKLGLLKIVSMEEINKQEDVFNLISKGNRIKKKTINLEGQTLVIDNNNVSKICFSKCVFICDFLFVQNIINKDVRIEFIDCTFNCEVSFQNCRLGTLSFVNILFLKPLRIYKKFLYKNILEVDFFHFDNIDETGDIKDFKLITLDTEISISDLTVNSSLSFQNIKHIGGKFDFHRNNIGNNDYPILCSDIYNNSFTNVSFFGNTFHGRSHFSNNLFNRDIVYLEKTTSFEENNSFAKNVFDKIDFSKNNFIGKCVFNECEFLSTANFEECKNLDNSEIRFVACEFKGFTLFNHSNLNFLDIDRCAFEKSSSFSDATFNKIRLKEVKFLGGAYFDDIKINDVANELYLSENVSEWKRTLRTIKQELQKTENKIDYGRFRVYEFNAYRTELTNRKPKDKILSRANRENNRLSRDLFILRLSNAVSEYGTNWKRAFLFTLSFGFIAYFGITVIESQLTRSELSFDWSDINSFINGMFKFFIVTDFKSILDLKVAFEDKYCLYSIMAFLYRITFVGCKIIIAFGIYETVQSFRKFKV
jgi:hypothetical protein